MPKPMKRRILVYPYDRSFCATIVYQHELLTDTCVNAVLSPNGWGLVGKDAGYAGDRENTGIQVKSDETFHSELDNADILLIPSGEWSGGIRNRIMSFMLSALGKRKAVWCAAVLSDDECQKIKEACGNDSEFRYLLLEASNALPAQEPQKPRKLYRPSAPVVFIAEMVGDSDGYEVLLSLHQRFTSNGYRSSAFCNRADSMVWGAHMLPDYMNDPQAKPTAIITDFNNYIKQVEKNERPDVILIHLPECLMKYDDIFTNGYGVLPYILSQAVQPDYMVACIPYGEVPEAQLKKISETCKHRFGCEIGIFHMSGIHIDYNESLSKRKMVYDYLSVDDVENKLAQGYTHYSIPICNVRADNGRMLFANVMSALG